MSDFPDNDPESYDFSFGGGSLEFLPDIVAYERDEFEIFSDIESFESYLTNRKFEPEKILAPHSSEEEVTMCRFFGAKNSEAILAEI